MVAWVIPFFSPLWLTSNWTSIMEQKCLLHSTPGYSRDPSICTPKSVCTGSQGRLQSQASMTFLAEEVKGEDSEWKVCPAVYDAAGKNHCSLWERTTVTRWKKRKGKKADRQRWRNVFPSVCHGTLAKDPPTDLCDSPNGGSPYMGTPKATNTSPVAFSFCLFLQKKGS